MKTKILTTNILFVSFVILMMGTNVAESKLFHHIYTADNINLRFPALGRHFFDNKGNHLVQVSDYFYKIMNNPLQFNNSDFELYLDSSYSPRNEYDQIQGVPVKMDNYGNLIYFYNSNFMNYKVYVVNKEKNFKYFLEYKEAPMNWNLTRDYNIIDDHMYFKTGLIGFPYMYYLLYDKVSEKWTWDSSQHIDFPQKWSVNTPLSYVLGKKIMIPSDSGLVVYNHETKTYKLHKFPELEILITKNGEGVGISSASIDTTNKIATIALIAKKRAQIMQIYDKDSVRIWTMPHILTPAIEERPNNIDALIIPNRATPIDMKQTQFIFATLGNFIYWSKEVGFKNIPHDPAIFDTVDWIYKGPFYAMSDDTLLFSAGDKTYVINTKEFVKTFNDDFPYKNWKSSVEDWHIPGVPMMEIYGVSPSPASSHLDVNYFLDANHSDLRIKIFDNSGKEHPAPPYEITRQVGIDRTIRLNFANPLPPGVYILQLEENRYKCTQKFIVN